MVEYLLKEKEKAEEVVNFQAMQYQRALIKLEIINDMLEEAEKDEKVNAPAETEDRCVVCGEIIPEGRITCPNCETAVQ